jgi:putative transposase
MPKAVVQIAREKRVAAKLKRSDLQIETALRELQTTVQPDTFCLPEPAAPVVVLPSTVEARTTPVERVPLPSSTDAAEPSAAGRAFFPSAAERYEWLMRNRDAWSEGDAAWLRQYAASDDYAELHDYYEGRGLGWSDAGEAPGLKSVR